MFIYKIICLVATVNTLICQYTHSRHLL